MPLLFKAQIYMHNFLCLFYVGNSNIYHEYKTGLEALGFMRARALEFTGRRWKIWWWAPSLHTSHLTWAEVAVVEERHSPTSLKFTLKFQEIFAYLHLSN